MPSEALSESVRRRPSRSRARSLFFRACRWLHVYTSTALFGLLSFFCLTGLTLNHGWYGEKGEVAVERLPMDGELKALVTAGPLPDVRALGEWVAVHHGLVSPDSVDMELELGEIVLAYDVPAGYANVLLDLEAESVEIERQQGSPLGILNDLHKGRHSGRAWGLLIDFSALAMAVFALTGLVLLFQNRKIRAPGLWATACGLLTPFFLYLLFVPSIH